MLPVAASFLFLLCTVLAASPAWSQQALAAASTAALAFPSAPAPARTATATPAKKLPEHLFSLRLSRNDLLGLCRQDFRAIRSSASSRLSFSLPTQTEVAAEPGKLQPLFQLPRPEMSLGNYKLSLGAKGKGAGLRLILPD